MMKPCVVTNKYPSLWDDKQVRIKSGSGLTVFRHRGENLDTSSRPHVAHAVNFHGKTVSKCEREAAAGLHGTSWLSPSQTESESEWDPASRLYSPVIFKPPPLCLLQSCPPSRPLRKHVWLLFLLTCGQIQTESKNDSIEAPQPPCWKKKKKVMVGGEMFSRKVWHAPSAWHSKSWPQSRSNFRKPQTFVRITAQGRGRQQTFLPEGKCSRRFLWWINITKEQLSFTGRDNCHQTEPTVIVDCTRLIWITCWLTLWLFTLSSKNYWKGQT